MLTHQLNGNGNDKDELLIQEIIGLTGSNHSHDFYKKSIRVLGWERTRMEFREVAGWVNEGKDIDPAKVLTKLLSDAIKEYDQEEPKKRSPFCPSKEIVMQCFSNSRAPTSQDDGAIKSPFSISQKAFPTPTYISPRFFTLSSNKVKSDEVTVYIPVDGGVMVPTKILRGKRQRSKDAEELGLLNAEHARILDALNRIWVEQGCLIKGGLCFCLASVYRVAQLLGWKKFGGSTLVHLTDKISHLLSRPFYFLEKDREFSFLSMKTVFKPKGSKQNNFIEIYFSPEHSDFLRNKWTVRRSTNSLSIKSEVGWLLKVYLEPILISKHSKKDHTPYKIELFNLIDELNLPPAAWHYVKKLRRQQFKAAIREINRHTTVDGKYFDLKITQGSNPDDFLLEARLTGEPIFIEENKKQLTLFRDSAKAEDFPYNKSGHLDAIRRLQNVLQLVLKAVPSTPQ